MTLIMIDETLMTPNETLMTPNETLITPNETVIMIDDDRSCAIKCNYSLIKGH